MSGIAPPKLVISSGRHARACGRCRWAVGSRWGSKGSRWGSKGSKGSRLNSLGRKGSCWVQCWPAGNCEGKLDDGIGIRLKIEVTSLKFLCCLQVDVSNQRRLMSAGMNGTLRARWVRTRQGTQGSPGCVRVRQGDREQQGAGGGRGRAWQGAKRAGWHW